MMQRRDLSSGWQFRCLTYTPDYHQAQVKRLGWLPAEIPGHVHLDLLRNGVIADPFHRRGEVGAAWVDEQDWSYRTTFEWSPNPDLPRRLLRFEGLDTVCTVWLNGSQIAACDNMFLPLEVDVTHRLEAGLNELRIDFQSAVRVGRERRRDYFEREGLAWQTQWFDERAFVRKAQYMSGWDWGPRLVSCGIWSPVSLLEYRGRIQEVSFLQERLRSGRFRVWAEATTEGEGDLTLSVAGQVRKRGESPEWELPPNLWWPHGEGPQTLHLATADLNTGHRIEKRIGLRSVRLLRERDDLGRSFEFEVNGRRIYARGANWIPDDSFVCRIEPNAHRERIKRTTRLGTNMLRVWGGGFYESEAFYDACDEAGILVWQDFPYACSYYPDSEEHLRAAQDEAAVHVRRLRDRASLALWCGNNENEVLWLGPWGGPETAPPRYYGERIYSEALPAVVNELQPGANYIRTSPVGIPTEVGPEVQDPSLWGDSHYWNVWHGQGDWLFYEDSKTRFSSEYGFASSCSLALWRETLAADQVRADAPEVWWHNKTDKSPETFTGYAELHYPKSDSLEDWVYYSQLNQRDAIRHGVEHFRRNPYCRGSLIWQLNDCWPVQSWALEDYRRNLKIAGQELARLYAPVLISVSVSEGSAKLFVVNDASEPFHGVLQVELFDTVTGDRLSLQEHPLSRSPGERKVEATVDATAYDPCRTAIRARVEGQPETSRWAFFGEPKDMQFGPVDLVAEGEGETLKVRVNGFVADLVVWDEEDPKAVLGPVTNLPGWTARTAVNEILEYPVGARIRKLRMRSLLGEHTNSQNELASASS